MVFDDFSGFRPPRNDKKSMQKRDWENHPKKWLQNRFWRRFLLPETSQNPPKSLRKPKRSEACFATPWNPLGNRRKLTGGIAFGLPIWLSIWLGLLNQSIDRSFVKSSQVNGSHSMQSVQMATHMIRFSPSIHPSIHPSIDLPLVALIIKVRSATWHAPRIFLLTRQCNQKTV